MKKSIKNRGSESTFAAERLADYRGNCSVSVGSSSACGQSSNDNLDLEGACFDSFNSDQLPDAPEQSPAGNSIVKETRDMKEKKLSSGNLASNEGTRPKVVTVKHPESNKPKPTIKKNKPVQSDLDLDKKFLKCKEDGVKRLDLKILLSVEKLKRPVAIYIFGSG